MNCVQNALSEYYQKVWTKGFFKFLTHPKNLCLWKPFKNKLENTKHTAVKLKEKVLYTKVIQEPGSWVY